jgi:hypothetical protein
VGLIFHFYVETDGSDYHRSMRWVLDSTIQLLSLNPDVEAARSLKQKLLSFLVSVVIGTNTKPVGKAAVKTLEYFLVKNVVTLEDLEATYTASRPLPSDGHVKTDNEGHELWRRFSADIFHWMKFAIVAPAAGRLIGTLYQSLRSRGESEEAGLDIQTWLRWLVEFLEEEPSLVESTSTYLIVPLFKSNHAEALKMLQVTVEGEVESSRISTAGGDLSFDMLALLRLSILETGKKTGILGEPGKIQSGPSHLIRDRELTPMNQQESVLQVRKRACSFSIPEP